MTYMVGIFKKQENSIKSIPLDTKVYFQMSLLTNPGKTLLILLIKKLRLKLNLILVEIIKEF
jgi:hypothetical protein